MLIAALVVLADTLYKYSKGQASLWDVGLAALDCIPGMKGLTTLGGLAKGLKGGMAAVKGLRGGLKGMGLAVRGLGKSARGMIADGAKGAYNRVKSVVRSKGSDPIDMATGAMFLPQTDVELPGLLPLAFTRRIASDYRCGWWFGPTWASTIDQRLEIDEEGVVFVTEDGLLLAYPHPVAPEVPVLPESGPRRPLTRLGDGDYRVVDPLSGQTLQFARPDSDGIALPTRIIDRNRHTITFDYDDQGVPVGLRHSGGYHLKLETEEGRVTALSLASAAENGSDVVIKRYGYTDGNLTETVNSSGLPLKFTYDDRLRVTSWTDTNNRSYAYTYDKLDRCTAEGGEAGHISITLDYDGSDAAWADCRVTTLTTAEGATTRFVINSDSQVVAEIDPLGGTRRTTYDRHHRVLSETDALGCRTSYEINEQGQPTKISDPAGRDTRLEYNQHWLPTTIEQHDGRTRRRTYDDRGNCIALTDHAGCTTHFTYDDAGRLTAVTDPLGQVTTVACDDAGLPVEITDPLGAITRYARNAFGHPSVIVEPTGATTRLDWTVEGLLAGRTDAEGRTETWLYDGEGNCTSHIDELGGVSRFEYTHFDLLAARTGPDGARYEFAHDTQLRLVKVTNPQGLTWTYEYDTAGNLIAETDFDDRPLRYWYDAAGRMSARTNALGQTVLLQRNRLGQVVRKDAAGRVTTFAYDSADQLTEAVGPEATLTLRRDERGCLLEQVVNGRALSFEYDVAGRRTARTTPSGARSSWTYDLAGRRTGMVTSGRPIEFTYDAAGRELIRRIGGTLDLTQEFDPLGRLTGQTLTGPDGALVQHRAYSYRADGHLVSVDDRLTGAHRFELDTAGRVTAVRAAAWTERYAYDEAGNQRSAEWPTTHPGAESQGVREYKGTRITRAGRVRFEHDALGRVIRRQKTRLSRTPDTWHYEWDAEDRLTSLVAPDGTRWRYEYDPLGRRTAKLKVAGDGETIIERVDFTWDGATLCEQTTTAVGLPNPVTLTWDHQGLRPIAQTERITAAEAPQHEIDSRFYAIVTDLLGAPSELVDEQGVVAWGARSTLWGTTAWTADAPSYTPLRFPGQYFDPESGLHYNCFRHYDPETARYFSPDPLGLEPAPNPVSYVANPHTRSDPLGLAPYPNEHLADLPIHSRYDRFYVRAGELVDNRIASHPLTEAQMYGGEIAGHGGVRNLPNEDLTRFGGPQGNDPISGYRDWAPGDSVRFPGSQVHITGGHHRTAEIVRRIGSGEMDPDLLIEFALRR
ncbi:DUF6531 domain-containing protein [Streptomyces sp. NPDC024017]|uniref:DUF6531 domain-containing protein n=1 Tax=Streptomyces sp. NPDC024017 TaxID=3154326 RepID=UPI0034098249